MDADDDPRTAEQIAKSRIDREMTCGHCEQVKESTERRYDYHGIYFGRRCDACWKEQDPGRYEADEPIDAEPDSMGSERDW